MRSRAPRRGLATYCVLGLACAIAACGGDAAGPDGGVRLLVIPEAAMVAAGDVVLVRVEAEDALGRPVTVGSATLTIDHPEVAVPHAGGRIRAVAAGTTVIRARVDGHVGAAPLTVLGGPAHLALETYVGSYLPVLIHADSVAWNGEREYHEVFAVAGALTLSGGGEPRYEVDVRFVEYDVRTVDGKRVLARRLESREYDRGLVSYDAAGDLRMVSEFIFPLEHAAVPAPGGFVLDFRIPGTDDRLELFYRR